MPTNATTSPKQAIISVSSTHDSQPQTDTNMSIVLPYLGISEEHKSISAQDPLFMASSSYDSNLSIQIHSVSYDLLDYLNFTNTLASGNGDFIPEYNAVSQETALGLQNTSYLNSFVIEFNEPIDNSEIIQLELQSLNFDVFLDRIGYFAVDYRFDQFSVSYVFFATPSYLSFMTNSSGQLKFYLPQLSKINHPLDMLTNYSWISEASVLQEVVIHAYANDFYNLAAIFSKISLTRELPVEQLSEDVFSPPPVIPAATSLSLKPDSRYIVDASIERIIHTEIRAYGRLVLSESSISLSGTIDPLQLYPSHDLYIVFKNRASIIQLTSTSNWYNSTHIRITDLETIAFNATLKNISPPVIEAHHLAQGQNATFSGDNNLPGDLRIIHSRTKETLQLDINQVEIPLDWEQGDLWLLGLYENGSYFRRIFALSYSPAVLAMDTSFEISPVQQTTIPIRIMNVTSSEIFAPSSVTAVFNGSKVVNYGRLGIVINPNMIQDQMEISVNATHPGFIPVTFKLVISTYSFDPDVEISSIRSGLNNATISVRIASLLNWSSGATLVFKDESMSQDLRLSHPLTEFQLYNDTWQPNIAYQVQFVIRLDTGRESPQFSVGIPPYKGPNSSSNDGKDNSTVLASVGSFSLITVAGLIIKYYRDRTSGKLMSF